MSEQKHTPEPWYIGTGASQNAVMIRRDKARGQAIASVFYKHQFPTSLQGTGEANAARIVQCVNALAGVADPAAELARLRGIEKVYAAAVEECKWWRQLTGDHSPYPNMRGWYHHDGKGWFHSDEADAHDTARAEAGMEAL